MWVRKGVQGGVVVPPRRAQVRAMSTKPKLNRTLHLEPELAEQLAAEAARERRTTANLIRNLLADALAARRSERSAA